MNINWNKIVANGLFAGITALAAANIAGAGFYGWEIALTNAIIIGGMAFALEYKTEACIPLPEELPKSKRKALSHAILL